MTAIPEDVLNAPAEGRLLKCLHEAALIPEGVWRAYEDAVSDAYPLAQRRGELVWITLDDDEFDKLPVTDLRRHCICSPPA